MATRRILFISGSAGLGHVTRDLAIARELRRQAGDIHISWLASLTACRVLEAAGEDLMPECAQVADLAQVADAVAREHGTLLDYALAARAPERLNTDLILQLTAENPFDLVVGDETYWLASRLAEHPEYLRWPYVMIVDFVGVRRASPKLRELAVARVFNQSWVRWDRALFRDGRNSCLFVGEPADAAKGRLGIGLPDRRRHAAAHYEFVGYVVPCDPAELADRQQVRARLGYDARPLIVASIGGTAIGRELIELCAQAQPLIRRELPAAHMVLVCGPDLDPATVARDIGEAGDEGIDLRGFVTDLYEHFAACDVAVVQGGGTSTTELTALRRPFVYFPLEGHFEQEHDVAARLARHCAGVRMTRSRTTPERLAAVVVGQFGAVASYPPIPVDGAGKAARLILARLA